MDTDPDLRLYDLERYLLDDVSGRFRRGEPVSTFDFFCIIIWKANRAKTLMARGLASRSGAALDAAVQALLNDVRAAPSEEAKMKILFQRWSLWLPTASAILTILYPDAFTVYDVRACGQLQGDHSRAGRTSNVDRMWEGYVAYRDAVIAQTPPGLSLRDKDRVLWARSFREQLERDVRAGFGTGASATASVDDPEAEVMDTVTRRHAEHTTPTAPDPALGHG
ncbi:hypothetical protein [Deinococcus yunweiensis]|uniref:hypothetical protein n=1 Tax=Deinococcus yunweiensis TaxID=367282 RepID=UPI00398E54F1